MIKILGDYGFCFGVENAVSTLKKAKSKENKTVLFHPLIHNIKLNEKLMKENNAVLFNKNNLNKKDNILFSAHGHTIIDKEKYKEYKTFDATCPLILNRYNKLKKEYNQETTYLFLGKKTHQETISFLSHFNYLKLIDINNYLSDLNCLKLDKKTKTYLICQTTISFETYNKILTYLKEKTILVGNLSICPLYLKRIEDSFQTLDNINYKNSYLIVCGDKMSSNANEIFNTIVNKYKALKGTVAINFDDINKDEIKNKDIYIVSSTSVSKEEVISLKEELESIF